jgi:hypothetical protein
VVSLKEQEELKTHKMLQEFSLVMPNMIFEIFEIESDECKKSSKDVLQDIMKEIREIDEISKRKEKTVNDIKKEQDKFK